MRRALRFLLIILSAAFILTFSAIIISASAQSTTEAYIVDGIGYADWPSAVSAADGVKTIYLNDDISITATVTINSKVKLNLNGHTLTSNQSSVSSYMFSLTAGSDFIIEGEGEIKNVPILIKAASGAKLSVKGLGKGIYIDLRLNADKVFTLLPGSETYITGIINATPAGIGKNLFYIGTNKNKIATAKLVIDGAKFTLGEPSSDAYRNNSGNAINFLSAEDASDIVIKDSLINIVHGDFIELVSTSASTLTAGGIDGISATSYKGVITAPTVLIDIDSSEIIAGVSDYTRAVHSNQYYGAGILFSVLDKATEIRVDNSKLTGTNRTIVGKSLKDNANTTSAFLYFTNVDYSSASLSLYNSCRLVSEKVNLVWNGGKISFMNPKRATKGTISSVNDEGKTIDPFGAEAAAGLGLNSIPDNYVYYHNTTNKTFTYYTYTMTAGEAISGGCVGYSEMKKATDSNGNVTGYTKISDGETADACFGLLFKNVYFKYAPSDSATTVFGASALYSTDGNAYDNVIIKDEYWSEAEIYEKAFLDTPLNEKVFDVVNSYTALYNPTAGYIASSNAGVASQGVDSEPCIVKVNRDFGVHENVVSKDGLNGYFKFSVGADETDSSIENPCFEMKIGTGSASYFNYFDEASNETVTGAKETASRDFTLDSNSAGYSLESYKFVVHEFDVATDADSYVKALPSLITGFASISFDSESGKYSISSSSEAQGNFYSSAISETGELSFLASSGAIGLKVGESVKLPKDGTWTRFSYVYEICGWDSANEYKVGELTRAKAKMKLNMHVYVNSKWAASFCNVLTAAIDTELSETLYLDSMRYNLYCNRGSILIDNNRVSYYGEEDTVACSALSALMENAESGISSTDVFNFFPDNNTIYDPFAYVDGEICQTEGELLSAIKNGSVVELKKPFASDSLELNKNVIFKTNGINMPNIISSSYKLVSFSDGIYNLVLADESEIFSLRYESDKFGINLTQGSAAIGTVVSPRLEVNESITEGDDIIYLVGWTLRDGNDSLAVSPELAEGGRLTLYPIYKSAVTVIWVDNYGSELERKHYKPQSGAFSDEYIDARIQNINTGNGWYNLQYESHKPISISESGTYTVYPHMVAVPIGEEDPDAANILINLSLYTDYVLNIYIPSYSLPEKIDSIVISKDIDGKSPLRAKDVIIKGERHTMFSDNYGVADTTINIYYIIYSIDGAVLTKTIEYGIPYYACTVMNDDTQQMVTEKAKSLVMNMVRYSLSVIDYCGSKLDASIYRELVNNKDFASYIVSYDKDELYLEGGAIYEDEIKWLSYKDTALDNPETDIDESTLEAEKMKYASYWIKGAAFYFSTDNPAFIIEYSENAEEKFSGIKEPNSNGSYGFWDSAGMFLYIGVESNNERTGPGFHVAYRGTIYDGVKILPGDEWDSRKYGSENSYYAIALMSAEGSNDYCKYSIYNMAETLTIDIYNNDGKDDGTNDPNNFINNDAFPGDGVSATYSLSAYIMEMILLEREQLALSAASDDVAIKSEYARAAREYRLAANTAMALYSYAKVARDYMGIEALPCYQ